MFYESLYRIDEKTNTKVPEKLTEQSLEKPYFCYGFKVYEALLENFEGPSMNMLIRFFYNVIDFKWTSALGILKNQIVKEPELRESRYLITIFENLNFVQTEVVKID